MKKTIDFAGGLYHLEAPDVDVVSLYTELRLEDCVYLYFNVAYKDHIRVDIWNRDDPALKGEALLVKEGLRWKIGYWEDVSRGWRNRKNFVLGLEKQIIGAICTYFSGEEYTSKYVYALRLSLDRDIETLLRTPIYNGCSESYMMSAKKLLFIEVMEKYILYKYLAEQTFGKRI